MNTQNPISQDLSGTAHDARPSEHTPTPWITRDGMICRGGYAPHTRSTLKADAELIVKAVNSHDALVEFVRDLLDEGEGEVTGSCGHDHSCDDCCGLGFTLPEDY